MLFKRAYSGAETGVGGPTRGELTELADRLSAEHDNYAKYKILRIFGFAGDTTFRHQVEAFLAGPSAELARTALYVLCNYFDLTSEYIEVLHDFIVGVPWDEGGACQIAAYSIADGYLQTNKDPRLINALIIVAEAKGTDAYFREDAMNALRRALQLYDDPDSLVLEKSRAFVTEQH
jgi:hypothetical protein